MDLLSAENKAVLAPMAGFCDIVMRKVCDSFGAAGATSEMVSARALNYGDRKSHELMATWSHDGKYGIQLFGFDPADFSAAVPIALTYSPDFIDINMGCPAPKITGNGSGSALMKNIPLAKSIVESCVKTAGEVPVTVKMRLGWDNDSVTYLELADRVREAGAKLITLHRRTRKQMYTPGIDIDAIKTLKEHTNLPVIGNGDINTSADALHMLSYTGCDMVMIGRAALSRPWIFSQVSDAVNGRNPDPEPSLHDRMDLLLWHVEKLCEVNGEVGGMRQARGQCALYMKGLKGAARLRFMTNSLTRLEDAKRLVEEVYKENRDV